MPSGAGLVTGVRVSETDQSDGGQLLVDSFVAMHAGVYVTDAAGRALVVNPAALRLLGREGEQLAGVSMHDLAHYQTGDGRPRSATSCSLLSVITTGRPTRSNDDVFWRADGTPLPVSWVSAPVVRDGQVAGAVVVFMEETRRHVEREQLLARHRESVEARERLAEANARLALLGRLSEALTTLDTDEALGRLARLSLGRAADWCVVDELREQDVRRVAVALGDGRDVQVPVPLALPPLTTASRGSLARVLAGGQQQEVRCGEAQSPAAQSPPIQSPPAQSLAVDPLDAEQARLFADLGCAHALVTPLTARHAVVGAMTWVRTDPSRPFSEEDAFLAAEVGRRAGVAVENARLYAQQRRAAETLQRSMLTVLPEPDHLHLTARYLPATSGAEVGGDWYDAFVLPDGVTGVVIGDILGHDLAAAAHMGQVRNLLRGVAADRLAPPSELLGRLDRAMATLRVGALATCLFARVEQSEEQRQAGLRELLWSSAGHLPPAVVSADGQVRLLEAEGDLMLGVAPELPREDHRALLQPGDTLWLYTDGLVERSDQPLEQGLTRLRRALGALAGTPLEEACDLLLARLLPEGHPDDVALLAVRAHPEDRPRPAEAGPSRP
jgi:PAS domain S-box-containing protein